MSTLRERRYQELRAHHFTPLEAREFSKLPRSNPGRKDMIAAREARWARFEKIAAGRVARGSWKRSQVIEKWAKNLARYYGRNQLRVMYGPTGAQQKIPKGAVNPWALYRKYERKQGGPDGKGYVSPWQVRQLRKGKTRLEKGLLFIQNLEMQTKAAGGVSKATIRGWIEQKDEAIKKARGGRKAQLMIERNRLERLL